MTIRIATFNVENLFSRPAAIDAQAELNGIVRKAVYSDADKDRLIELDQTYKFSALSAPPKALLVLVKVRGQLFSRTQAGVVSVVANGAGDWTGWFELPRDNVQWEATRNTARVIAEVSPDILVCVEAEDRHTLLRFNDKVLGAEFNQAYPHVMLVDGNDERGIDVGILSRFPIDALRSHVDDMDAHGGRVFSRDCPEYVVLLPSGQRLVVIPNHFKSKRGGNDQTAQKRRRAQAEAAASIAHNAEQTIAPLVLLAGDLNDTPDSHELAPLWASGFGDVQAHPDYPTDRPGTFGTATAANKIDYLIMSASLGAKLVHTGIERRGSYHPHLWQPFDTVTKKAEEASDHQCLWAEFDVG